MTPTRAANYALRVGILAAALGACLILGGEGRALAAAEVQIASVDCSGSPEVIELTNTGDQSQDLTGWKLESDPPATESYDLTPLGTLAPGSSVFIESGPDATATFTWSSREVLRNGDASDSVILIDNSGQTRMEMACVAEAQATPSPTVAPINATVIPTPTTAAADGVPDGGGPPSAATSALMSPLTVVVAGASLAGAGGAMFLGMWLTGIATLWRRPELTVYEAPLPPPPGAPKRASRRSQAGSEPILLALAVALCAAVFVALLAPSSSRHR